MKSIENRMIGFSLSPSLYSHLNVNDGFQVSLTKQKRSLEIINSFGAERELRPERMLKAHDREQVYVIKP